MVSRRRAWADTRIVDTLLGDGVALKTDLLAGAPTSDTLTAVRIIGELYVYFSNTDETEGRGSIDVGIGVSSGEAFAVGATALPDPTTTTEYPPRGWLYVATQPMVQTLPTGGTPVSIFRKEPIFKFDLGAMRKIDKGTLFLLVEQNVIGGVLSPRLMGRVRVLCLT